MSANVYKKIHEIMKDIQYLKKDGKVNFGNTKYSYLSEEKITENIRNSMLKVGLVMYPVSTKYQHMEDQKGEIVVVDYALADIESGEHITIQVAGKGCDTQDKSIPKAMTCAFKYAMRQTFCIATGDDFDKVSSAELDEVIAADAKKTAQDIWKSKICAEIRVLGIRKGKTESDLIEACKKHYKKEFLEALDKGELEKIREGLKRLPDIEAVLEAENGST